MYSVFSCPQIHWIDLFNVMNLGFVLKRNKLRTNIWILSVADLQVGLRPISGREEPPRHLTLERDAGRRTTKQNKTGQSKAITQTYTVGTVKKRERKRWLTWSIIEPDWNLVETKLINSLTRFTQMPVEESILNNTRLSISI